VWDKGREESLADIAAGNAKLFWQTRSFWGRYMTKLFAERFNVEVVHRDCVTTQEQTAFQGGYNRATADDVDATFGVGAYQSALDDVEAHRLRVCAGEAQPGDSDSET